MGFILEDYRERKRVRKKETQCYLILEEQQEDKKNIHQR